MTCGGHYRAHRAEQECRAIVRELQERGETVQDNQYNQLQRWGLLV